MDRSLSTRTSFPGAAALERLLRSLVDLAKALRHRREIKHLAEFDDRMLKDIGLTRSDVYSALSEPLVRNPSWVLVRRAERESRHARNTHPVRQTRPVVPVVKPLKGCA
ncbi:uncharacterized protein YjiS (DUF1127 family) [Microvirga flocculans]|uniref:Uncharacterized protein YjiS (DUF1127 family) n=1 Tax=Microvirga flocculans TaxID=217168 RepID=A0A7W6IEQ2_9HYPH|nr:DUF1127 domain-containing protein [Microvirga flocculans]MBB4040130.1 uncharacterized protein YjiS (DUF1127 family) [Microvirga flocculans]